MSGPSLADLIGSVPAFKALIDKLFAAIESVSPTVATQDEEAIRAALQAALSGIDVATLESSFASVLAVVKAGRGIQGGGADATLS